MRLRRLAATRFRNLATFDLDTDAPVVVFHGANAQGKTLNLTLGFSHPVDFPVPDGIAIEVDDQTKIKISGIDKQQVGEIAAQRVAEKELAREVVLIDILEGIPQGKALDQWESAPIEGFDTRVVGSQERAGEAAPQPEAVGLVRIDLPLAETRKFEVGDAASQALLAHGVRHVTPDAGRGEAALPPVSLLVNALREDGTLAATWIGGEVLNRGVAGTADNETYLVTASRLAELLGLLREDRITGPTAKNLFGRLVGGETRRPADLVYVRVQDADQNQDAGTAESVDVSLLTSGLVGGDMYASAAEAANIESTMAETTRKTKEAGMTSLISQRCGKPPGSPLISPDV